MIMIRRVDDSVHRKDRLQGYARLIGCYSLPPIRLSRKEVFRFSIARKLLGAFEGTPLEMDMRSTLSKIEESLEGSISMDVEGLAGL